MPDESVHSFLGVDGVELSYRELGQGRPIVLLHGYLVAAEDTWVRSGIAARLAAAGRRVVMPDLRGHGASVPSRDPADYPPDALTGDAMALVDRLGGEGYDLGGYSVGGRVVARMLALGARPVRAIIGGTGLEPIVAAAGRGDGYRRMLADLASTEGDDAVAGPVPGPAARDLGAYLRSVGADPVALALVLDTFVDTPIAKLEAIEVPTLILAGEDEDRGSVEDLAAAIPGAELRCVPGDHGTAARSPEFAAAMLEFLSRRP